MTYLVDTHWVASALNGRIEATNLLQMLAPAGIAISLITFGEIYEGIYYSTRTDPKVAERGFLLFLRAVPVLPLNRAIMREFARIRGQLRAQGQIISDDDLLIAATALHHNLVLVTQNIRHFGRIPALRIHQQA